MQREVLRKAVHMAAVGVAFAIPWIGVAGAAVVALTAFFFNLLVLPRIGGRILWRDYELSRGTSVGIVFYPLVVFFLLLLFRHRPEVAAATWGIFALGDGMAALAGQNLGHRPLPWNRRKSWTGSLAYWLFGSLGAGVLLVWTVHFRGGALDSTFAVGAAVTAALFSASLESQPQNLDDNLWVPLVTGLFLFGLVLSESWWSGPGPRQSLPDLAVGLGINLAVAVAAWRAQSVDTSGAIAGLALGTVLFGFLGWQGYLLLVAFFVVGSVATRLGFQRKATMRLAQEAAGRRSARHAFANAGVPILLAVFAVTTPHGELLIVACAAAFAAALADTLSSEIGQLWGRRPVLITTFEPVQPGTDGGVTIAGTMAGLGGAALIAGLGWAAGFYGAFGGLVVTVAGFVAPLVESVIGATLERRGLLDNEGVNFLNTVAGGLGAAVMVTLAG